MDDLITHKGRGLLVERLSTAFVTVQALHTWLQLHLQPALHHLAAGSLVAELADLFTWASAEDGLRTLLQTLAGHPPADAPDLPVIIMALSGGEIRPPAPASHGPEVLPHQRLLAADRPFVNRLSLRQQLEVFAQAPPGARRILLIDGEARTGKSFAVSLAFGCQPGDAAPPPIDINDYAASAATVDARELAEQIVGDAAGMPPYDATKEDEAVPRLLAWMGKRLQQQPDRWIIIDHCNRPVLTRGARALILALAIKLHGGLFTSARLILVDFDRAALPAQLQFSVLHDRAALPDENHVADWCRQFAASQRRRHAEAQPAAWASDVFTAAGPGPRDDGSWHVEFERQLHRTRERILQCEVLP